MNEHRFRILLEGGGGIAGTALRTALWLPGAVYGQAMRLRRLAYERNVFSSQRIPAPVVSIGNLTAGGSGKTPFTAFLANHLLARNLKPAILLRGYRQNADGRSDEAILYQTLCPGAMVVVGGNRVASAQQALADGANVVLMDDGMQHLRLRRDLDIVLVDATAPWGGGNTIPGGLLREPITTLSRAGIVVLTRSDQISPGTLAALRDKAATLAPHAALFTARHAPTRLYVQNQPQALSLDRLRGQAVVALAGIARPEAFHKTLEQSGARVIASFTGPDHRDFDPQLVTDAFACATAGNAVVVTTEKDAGKRPFPCTADNGAVDNIKRGELPPLWVLGVDHEVDNRQELVALVERTVETCRKEVAERRN